MRHTSFGQQAFSFFDRLIAHVRLAKILPLIPDQAEMLDLGCGYKGHLLNTVADHITSGVGIDLSVAVQPQVHTNITLQNGRVDASLPYPAKHFSVITALAIIEHVEDPETMLRECYRVLKPGGKLLITTPSLYGKPVLECMAYLHLISKVEIDDHKRYYRQTTLQSALIKAGFTESHVRVRPFGLGYLNLFAEAVK